MKISLDQDRCVGSGWCVMAAPDVFGQRDKDGLAVLLTPQPRHKQAIDVRHAAAMCPALAIRIGD